MMQNPSNSSFHKSSSQPFLYFKQRWPFHTSLLKYLHKITFSPQLFTCTHCQYQMSMWQESTFCPSARDVFSFRWTIQTCMWSLQVCTVLLSPPIMAATASSDTCGWWIWSKTHRLSHLLCLIAPLRSCLPSCRSSVIMSSNEPSLAASLHVHDIWNEKKKW